MSRPSRCPRGRKSDWSEQGFASGREEASRTSRAAPASESRSSPVARMAIIGHGARTPLGLDCRASAAAVGAGIPAIADHPFMIDRFGWPMKVTRDAELDPGRPCVERIAALAEAAAQEALAGGARAMKLALVLNLGEPRPGLPEGTSAEVAERLRAALELDGPVHHAMRGHAGGHRRDRGCGTAARSGPRGGRAGRGRGK